jgi:3-methyladenine DNA glycosylase AlkC
MAEQLKNMFSQQLLAGLSKRIKKEYSPFSEKKFLHHFQTEEWKQAELKRRVRLVTEAMHEQMPQCFEDAIAILIPASSHFSWGFVGVIFPDYVELYGREHWKTSMHALSEFTQTSTAEFAIRPFIVDNQDRAMKQMLQWSKSSNHHIRRLSSEGCRPRLPWGIRLHELMNNPSVILPILENLKEDPELYVRKSVANNLNDISKDHPELVLSIAEKWIGKHDHTDWIVKHGLRTLLKSGNKRALSIFGHHEIKGLEVEKLKLSATKIKLGETLAFSFELKNITKTALECRVEYAIDFVKANNSHSKKIFQIAKMKVESGVHVIKRNQRFVDLTTRVHYSGKHIIHIVLNGETLASQAFELTR